MIRKVTLASKVSWCFWGEFANNELPVTTQKRHSSFSYYTINTKKRWYRVNQRGRLSSFYI